MSDSSRRQQRQQRENLLSNYHDSNSNLDPAVVALLEPLPVEATVHQLQTRIALIRLRQEHVRGHSTYAADLLERACQDATTGRHTYEVLGARMAQLEEQQQDLFARDQNRKTGTIDEERTAKSETRGRQDDGCVNDSYDEKKAHENVNQEDAPRIQELERLLEARLLAELEYCRVDQDKLLQDDRRLRDRIQSIRNCVQQHTNRSRALEQALADLQIDTPTQAECTVCYQRRAAYAIIPCGHLCLCRGCSDELVKQHQPKDNGTAQCPLCRGHMLSTLQIFGSNI